MRVKAVTKFKQEFINKLALNLTEDDIFMDNDTIRHIEDKNIII